MRWPECLLTCHWPWPYTYTNKHRLHPNKCEHRSCAVQDEGRADAATLVLKGSIGRGRPYVNGDKRNFKPLQFDSDYDSLPSMHAASSFAVASVMSGASESLW